MARHDSALAQVLALPAVIVAVIAPLSGACRADAPPERSQTESETAVAPAPAPIPPPATPSATVAEPRPAPEKRKRAVTSFAVYALSRGKGVPPETREALQRVRSLAESDRSRGVEVTIVESRIGIEGETRVCLEYADPREGARALDETRALVKGADLINVVVEPCRTQKKEDRS